MDNVWVNIFAFGCLFFILSYFLYILYYAIGLYDLNPFFRPIPLKDLEKRLLSKHIEAIKHLDEGQKEKLYKRVAWFRAKKTFTFKSETFDKEAIILLISSAGMLLTLGFKNYKFIRSIHRIVIHPTDYYSSFNKRYHLGEYNPGLKALAFAADTLVFGFEDDSDNINLAIHEFAHALYFETKGKNSWGALRFQWGFRKLERRFNNKEFVLTTLDSGYFRKYAKKNPYEFLAVITENFIETPDTFHANYPELYNVLKTMYNFNPVAPKGVK